MHLSINDDDFLQLLKEGNLVAFDNIYLRYSKPIYIYLLDRLKDPDQCNDILQDIFVNLWEKRATVQISTSLKAYLYQAARYKIIDLYRKDVKYQKYLFDLGNYLDSGYIMEDTIDHRKLLMEVKNTIDNFPARMREIFIMSRFEHESIEKIAEKMQISPQTVKNQISKALRILRSNFNNTDSILLILSSLYALKGL